MTIKNTLYVPNNVTNTNIIVSPETNAFIIEKEGEDIRRDFYLNQANEAAENFRQKGFFTDKKTIDKYDKYGIRYNPQDYASGKLDYQLAENQSNWEKAFNALGQTVVSEILLGTVRGFSDLFDFVGSKILHVTDDDYQNPVSEQVQSWQEHFKNNIAPIYTTPGVDIGHGGFKDFGWWMSNLPTVASSLTLLIPSTTVSKGISLLGKAAKATKLGNKVTSKTAKWLSGANKIEKGGELNAFNKLYTNPRARAIGDLAVRNIGEGTLMRIMENYQEARDVHVQTYENALDTFSKMKEEEYQKWIDVNKDMFDEDVDLNNKDEVAKSIAKKAADRTFTMDFSNVVFDIIQLAGLRNVGKGIKKATGAAVQKAQRKSIEEAAESAGLALEKTTKKANKLGNALRTAGDFTKANAWPATKFIAEQGSEGVEEIVNYIAQKEGLTYGKAILDGKGKEYKVLDIPEWSKYATLGLANLAELPNLISTWSNMQNPLGDYWDDAELQESAFWGFMGGMIFGGAGNLRNKIELMQENKKLKKENEKENETTKEKLNIKQNIKDLFDLAETSDTKAAKTAIAKRKYHLEQLKDKLDMINGPDGRNPYAEPDENNVHPKFTSVEEQDIARQRAIDDMQTELVLDAIFSGTYDMLLDFWQSDNVKAAMNKILESNPEETKANVENFVQFAENIKKRYNDEVSTVMALATALNAEYDYDKQIPIQYVQQIARNNVSNSLTIDEINRQVAIIDQSIADQESKNQAFDENPEVSARQREEVKQQIEFNHLATFYALLEKQKEELNKLPDNWQKEKQLRNIRKQQRTIADQLNKLIIPGTEGTAGGYTAVAAAMHFASSLIDVNGKTKITPDAEFKLADKEIIKKFEELYSKEELDAKTLFDKEGSFDKTSKLWAKQIIKNRIKSAKDENSLENKNPHLLKLYAHRSDLLRTKEVYINARVSDKRSMKDQVDYLHNRNNAARTKLLEQADDVIANIYKKYTDNKNTPENKQLFQYVIVSVSRGNLNEATDTLKAIGLTDNEIKDFLNALNILNLSSAVNEDLIDTILFHFQIIDRGRKQGNEFKEASEKEEKATQEKEDKKEKEEENSSTSENPISEQQNQEQGKLSETPLQTISKAETQQIEGVENESKHKPKPIRVKINLDGSNNFKGIGKVKSNHKNVDLAYEDEKGNIEVELSQASPNTIVKYIDAGILRREDDVDLLNDNVAVTTNPVFEYKNGKYTLLSAGVVSKVDTPYEAPITNNRTTDETSSPVEKNDTTTKESVSKPIEAETEEEEKVKLPTQTEQDRNIEAFASNITDNPVHQVETEDATISSTGEATQTSETSTEQKATPVNENASQSESLRQEDLEFRVKEGFRHILSKNGTSLSKVSIDKFNELVPEIRELVTNHCKGKGYSEEEINDIFAETEANMRETINFISSRKTAASKSAAALGTLANESKREEIDVNLYGNNNLFNTTISDFLQHYVDATILPDITIKEGDHNITKKVVSLEDILRICNNACQSIDGSIGRNLYDMVVAYLNTPEAKAKYYIIDSFKEKETIIKDATSSIGQKMNSTLNTDVIEENVDIEDVIKHSDEGREVINSLAKGDKLQIQKVEGNKKEILFYKQVDGKKVIVGRVPLARNYNNKYVQLNDGWVTDVRYGSNGVQSDCETIIKTIFLANSTGIITLSDNRIIDLGTIDDKEKVKDILLRYSLGINANNTDLVNEFKDTTIFKNLEKQSIDEVTKYLDPNTPKKDKIPYKNILFVHDGKVDAERVLRHLARSYNYTTLFGNSEDKSINERILSASLDRWFTNLYNTYNNLKNYYDSTENDEEVIVSKVSSGSLIRPYDENGNRIYNKPTSVIKDKSKVKIGIVSKEEKLAISGSGLVDVETSIGGKGNTFIRVESNNKTPDYARAIGIDGSKQSKLDNPLMQKIYNGCQQALATAIYNLQNAVQYNSNVDGSIKELQNLLNKLVVTRESNNNALLRPIYEGNAANFNIDIQEANGYKSIAIQYWVNKKLSAEVRLYTKTPKQQNQNSLSVRIKGELVGNPEMVTSKITNIGSGSIEFGDKYYASSNDNVATMISAILFNKGAINISEEAINADSVDNATLDGFFSRKDGKTIFEIPGTNVKVESDSYNDFLIDNDLIKVNLGKDDKGENFEKRGKNQKLNQILSVILPKIKIQSNVETKTSTESQTTSRDVVEKTSIIETRNKIKDIINKHEATVGIDIFKEVLGEQEYERFKSIVGEEFNVLEDLLPNNISYVPEINYYGTDGSIKGVLAYSLGNRDYKHTTYKYYNDKGERITGNYKEGQNVLIGSRLLNALSDRNKFRRNQAIRKLIHEQLHSLVQSDSKRRDALLKEIEDVYNIFLKSMDAKSKEVLSEKEREEVTRILDILKDYRYKPELRDRALEEFLVESLTNSNFANQLNSIKVENEHDNKKDSLFSRILRALAKFFGWNIEDNSLYMKELNALANILTTSDDKAEPVIEKEVVEETKTNNKEAKVEEENEEDDYSEFFDEANEASLEEVGSTNIGTLIKENNNINDNITIVTRNIDAFVDKLGDKASVTFTQDLNYGEISMKCK